jgi:hypothetical protein
MVRWIGGLGAVTAEAFARHLGVSRASARARLSAGARAGLVSRTQVLAGEPALYTITASAVRAAGLGGLGPCRVSAANAEHAITCALVAAVLERAYPDHSVMGERELRREEREAGVALASASVGGSPHRPDLVLWPDGAADERLPVAVEVELTVKAPRRLEDICRGWARARCVAGTLYLAASDVQRPLSRAIERARAGERIALVGLDALVGFDEDPARPRESTVAGGA